MKQIKLSVLALLVVAATLASSAIAFDVPKTPLSIDPPPGWTKNDSGMMGTYIIFLDQPRDGFSANFNALSESTAGYSVNDYMEATLKSLNQALEGFKLRERRDLTINGMQVVSLVYTGKSNNLKLTWIQYFFFYKGTSYIFTGTMLNKYSDEYIPVFQRIFSTVKVAGPSYNPPPTYQQPDYGTPPPTSGPGNDK